jgi:hypothetical protein
VAPPSDRLPGRAGPPPLEGGPAWPPLETARPYTSPVLDDVARRAFARLVLAGSRGMTVRDLAEEIGANPSTVGNVLRGASSYGSTPFARAGWQGRAHRWRARGIAAQPSRPDVPALGERNQSAASSAGGIEIRPSPPRGRAVAR